MTLTLAALRRTGRAAAVALALGAATVAAVPAPAMAQAGPSFSFQIGGNDGNLTFRFGDDRRERVRHCLTNTEIRRGLRAHGFRNIDIVRLRSNNRVEVIASYGSRWYLMTVNRCTGRVQIIERLRRGFPGGGFGLHFEFGN